MVLLNDTLLIVLTAIPSILAGVAAIVAAARTARKVERYRLLADGRYEEIIAHVNGGAKPERSIEQVLEVSPIGPESASATQEELSG